MTAHCIATESRLAYETGACEHGDMLRPGGSNLTTRAIEYCRLKAGTRVLDVGCGAGHSSRYLWQVFHLNVTGIDISFSACSRTLAEDDRARLVQGSAASLPFATGSIEAVIAECSLSLVEDKEMALAECFRVLSGEGHLVVTDMYARNPHAAAYLRALPRTCVSGMIVREELEAELANQGFLVKIWEDHSDVLKQLLFRFVMERGNPQQIWTWQGTKKEEAESIKHAMREARPGYFLLVAAKKPQSICQGKGERQ